MAQKQAININFSQGLDTKTDSKQVGLGKFSVLKNSVFSVGGRLTKRNGFGRIAQFDVPYATSLTTFNGSLVGVGSSISVLSESTGQIVPRGTFQPVELSTLPAVRTSYSAQSCDLAVSDSGLACVAYYDSSAQGYYQIIEEDSGTVIVPVTQLPTGSSNVRAYVLGSYFIVTFVRTITAVVHLQYIAIPIASPESPLAAADISIQVGSNGAYDAFSANGLLYLAWNGSDGGGAIRTRFLTAALNQSSVGVIAGITATYLSVTLDTSGGSPIVWVSYYDTPSTTIYTTAFNASLIVVLAPVVVLAGATISQMTSVANLGVNKIFYEENVTYSYSPNAASHAIYSSTVTQAGVVGSTTQVLRSVGLASKAFRYSVNGVIYMLAFFAGPNQPTYFLIDENGTVLAKLAYSNGARISSPVITSVNQDGGIIRVAYLYKGTIQAINKETNVGTAGGIYAQAGINVATFTLGGSATATAETGGALNLTGGFLWEFDGQKPVEQGFHVYPDDIGVTTSVTGGLLTAQKYFYQVTYEWTDAAGNINRSAPSVPVSITTTGTTSSNTVNIPYLRLTRKVSPNPVRVVIYRWSANQQTYYQVTSITSPQLNNVNADDFAYLDTLADSAILGNNVLYTTGGVVENIGGPAFKSVFLFDNRLWGITSEDRNLLWQSKQVIENTPVEMSDLLTLYVAPNIGSEGPSGDMNCGFPMDDKAILFKDSSLLYFNGTGPDITGANSQYSQPILINSTVGCANQASIVLIPNGLMFEFQSESGNQIWLLGRDLSSSFIGAPVTQYTQGATVQSAVNIPGTNQVRFTMSSGITLVFDYFFGQWGTFTGTPAISSTLYQGLHTYLDSYGQVFKETPGLYLDGSRPVTVGFVTGWINAAGLRGYERLHEFTFLGEYYSPHKLTIQVAYDYGFPEHQSVYIPTNFAAPYGGESLYGGGSYGGPGSIEQFRVFAKRQKCKAFQITVEESYDADLGQAAGQGLSLSGVSFIVSLKKGYAPSIGRNSVG